MKSFFLKPSIRLFIGVVLCLACATLLVQRAFAEDNTTYDQGGSVKVALHTATPKAAVLNDNLALQSDFEFAGSTSGLSQQDIMLGMFDSTGSGGTNRIFASWDGQNLSQIATVFKTKNDGIGPYMGDHWPQACPSIMYYKGYFWAISGWNRNDGKIWVVISYSKDLVHWTHPEGMSIPVATRPSAQPQGMQFDIVAPEWSVCSDGNVYIVVSCGYYGAFHGEPTKDRMQAYTIKVTNLSARDGFPDGSSGYLWPSGLVFKTQKAQRLTFTKAPDANYIDGSFYSEGKITYLAIKEGGVNNVLYRTATPNNPSSWKKVSKMTQGLEAPSITRLNGNYFLYCDRLAGAVADGTRFAYTKKINQKGMWSSPRDPLYRTSKGKVIPVSKVRHGSVITLKAGTPEWQAAYKLLSKCAKLKNNAKIKPLKGVVEVASAKSNSQKISPRKYIAVTSPQGKISFKRLGGDNRLSVASNGVITVAKGTPSGTYAVKVQLNVSGNNTYKKASKTVILRVVVK